MVIFFLKIHLLLCIQMLCLHICMCTTGMLGARRAQKRALYPLKLALQMIVSRREDAGN